jgi:hypothetical protein
MLAKAEPDVNTHLSSQVELLESCVNMIHDDRWGGDDQEWEMMSSWKGMERLEGGRGGKLEVERWSGEGEVQVGSLCTGRNNFILVEWLESSDAGSGVTKLACFFLLFVYVIILFYVLYFRYRYCFWLPFSDDSNLFGQLCHTR